MKKTINTLIVLGLTATLNTGCLQTGGFKKEEGALGMAANANLISAKQKDLIKKVAEFAFGVTENPVAGLTPEERYFLRDLVDANKWNQIDPQNLKREVVWRQTSYGAGAVGFSNPSSPVSGTSTNDDFSRENIAAMLRAAGITKVEDVDKVVQ